MAQRLINAAGVHPRGWKLNQLSLMKLVCLETARMEAVHVQQLPYVFQRLPLNPRGNLPLPEVCHSLTCPHITTLTILPWTIKVIVRQQACRDFASWAAHCKYWSPKAIMYTALI